MARVSRSASWVVPNGDLGALRLTAEVFIAHCGVDVQVRNGGTIIGRQGSSLKTCLCLLVFAPVRLLPKRVRVDVIEESGQVGVGAFLEDSFFIPKLSGIVAGRYERQFDDWLAHLRGQVLPSAIQPDGLDMEATEPQPVDVVGASEAVGREATTSELSALFADEPQDDIDLDIEPKAVPGLSNHVHRAGVLSHDARQAAELQTAPASQPEQEIQKPASSGRGGFGFPKFGFRRQERQPEVSNLPDEVRRHISLADQAADAKAWSRVLTHYDAAVQALQGGHEVSEPFAVSRLFFNRGIARFSQAQDSLGSSQETGRSVSDYQIALEKTRQAVADYSEAIHRDPGWSMGYYRRGQAHLFAARCERGSRNFRRSSEALSEAIADLTRATEQDPNFASAFALRADAHSLLGQYQEAEADLEKAVSLGTDESTIRKVLPPTRNVEAAELPAETEGIEEPEWGGEDAMPLRGESTDFGGRIESGTDRESPGAPLTDASSQVDSRVTRAEPSAVPVDVPAASEEARHSRLRLPKLPPLGRQKQEEIGLTGVGVIALTEVSLGEHEFAAKNWERAIQHFDIALHSVGDPPAPDWSNARAFARVYLKRGVARFTKAQIELESGRISREPVGNGSAGIEMIQASVFDYSEAIRLDPTWPMSYSRRGEAHLFLARCHFGAKKAKKALKELDEALEDLTLATERDPNFASAFAVRAVAYALLEDDQKSEADVERAVSLGADAAIIRRAIRASKSWRS